MKEFRRVWDRVPGVVSPEVVLPFNPTHVLLENFPGPVRFDSFIEDDILPVTGWNPAMWVRLGMLIQEGRGK